MKISPLSGEPFYRMHTPRWAVAPTSGAGAAKHGGRFNRRGVPALYLADKPQTAIARSRIEKKLKSIKPHPTDKDGSLVSAA